MNSYVLRGDANRNGFIDNDNEARRNTEFNSIDIDKLNNELKKLTKRVKINTVLANNAGRDNTTFASTAKIAEELSDGKQRVYFNNIGKSVVYKYGNKQMTSCIQIGTYDNIIKNLSALRFQNNSLISGVVQSTENVSSEDAPTLIPSVNLLQNYCQDYLTAQDIKDDEAYNVKVSIDYKEDLGYPKEVEVKLLG